MYNARIKLPAHLSYSDISKLSEALGDVSQAHIAIREENNDNAPWILEWITQDKPQIQDLDLRLSLMAELGQVEIHVGSSDWVVEAIPQIDWLERSYKQFPSFSVGPFFIYGSHCDDPVPQGQMGLQIDAATAFGSGEHGTTKGCLQAMLDLKGQGVCPWNILDMGTGSGVLAIAAWKLWKAPVLAIDNDEEAVRVAQRHCKANDIAPVSHCVLCAVNEGFGGDLVTKRGPYELIIANILAGSLKGMAEDLKAVTDENGYVILSGILIEQAQSILRVYEALGFALKKRYDIGEWATLVLHNARS